MCRGTLRMTVTCSGLAGINLDVMLAYDEAAGSMDLLYGQLVPDVLLVCRTLLVTLGEIKKSNLLYQSCIQEHKYLSHVT